MDSPASSEVDAAAGPVGVEQLRDIVHGTVGRPGLIDALPRLQRSHRKELIRVERWTTGDLARHPEPRSLIRSRRKPGNLDEHGRLRRVFDQRRVLTDLLGSYELRPGTVVYAGYGAMFEQRELRDGQWIERQGPYVGTGRGLFFKASYLYRF